jgi:hypothetical protein
MDARRLAGVADAETVAKKLTGTRNIPKHEVHQKSLKHDQEQ